jgi:excisionase family DNA binding protein
MNIPGEELRREGLSVVEACRIAGIGRTKVYEAIADGRLKARKFGNAQSFCVANCKTSSQLCR